MARVTGLILGLLIASAALALSGCLDWDIPDDYGDTGGEDCTNGVDDDGDTFADCADDDCLSHWACGGSDEDCTNGIDDDGDSFTDCADDDCLFDLNCSSGYEYNCSDFFDNDGDGYEDCDDSDCAYDPNCTW